MSSKNDPNNRVKGVKKKLIGRCGDEVVPAYVKGIKGRGRMVRYCEKHGLVEK